ncbi:MAG TPA: 2-oxoacid:acceptor oxidoreductase family protein [Vicinamibacterales bacterium]|nr:2-oxoacid:acceptor oxidoreductase family protein [Vicinamibacterales bacterium]
MLAVRFHGRGGQGTVIASKLLASAMFREGWQVQAFPSFGAERSGAPVAAFLRADRAPITIHYQVYEPDHVVVLDPVLLGTVAVTSGLKAGGTILVNTPRSPEELALQGGFVVATCDATGIALRHGLGSRTTPIVNTAILGAWASLTRLVSLEAIVAEVTSLVPAKSEANIAAAREAFGAVTVLNHAGQEALKAAH